MKDGRLLHPHSMSVCVQSVHNCGNACLPASWPRTEEVNVKWHCAGRCHGCGPMASGNSADLDRFVRIKEGEEKSLPFLLVFALCISIQAITTKRLTVTTLWLLTLPKAIWYMQAGCVGVPWTGTAMRA
eukprot:scaffold112153_cov22-Tisochrysis_lutea.AAC.1